MSSTLTIEPLFRNKKTLSSELKFALKKRYLNGIFEQRFSEVDIPYFRGLLHAGIDDAQTVIDYIEKYEEILLNEEY